MRLLLLSLLAVPLFGITDILSVSDKTGSARTNVPIEIARPFVQGDFQAGQFPQAAVCTDATCTSTSSTLVTQVNVLRTWAADGSIAHAKLYWIMPLLGANATVYYTFIASSSCNCGVDQALTPAQMLSTSNPNYDFDAVEQLTQPYIQSIAGPGAVKSVSARAILANLPQAALNGAITNSATSISVSVTNGVFPAVPFDIWVWNSGTSPFGLERMRVTAVTGSAPNLSFTVLRGWDNTGAISHANNDSLWLGEMTYVGAGSVATTIKIFDPISKLNDIGWQPINMATFTGGYTTSSTSITGISSTGGWTANMLVRLQSTGAGPNFVPSPSTYVQYATLTPIDATSATVVAKGPYPGTVAFCNSFTNGRIWPDQWQDAGGNTQYNSFRPYLVVTFWPSLKKYHVVEFAGENGDSERAQDLHYDLVLKMGNAAQATVYQQTNIWHTYAKTWVIHRYNDPAATNTTQYAVGSETIKENAELWGGDPSVAPFYPGPVAINHGPTYLTQTAAVPNYDVGNTIPETQLAQAWDGNQDDPEGLKAFPGNWLPSGLTGTMDSNPATTTLTSSNGIYRSITPSAYSPFHITVGTGANAERMIVISGWSGNNWVVIRAQDGTTPHSHTNDPILFSNEIGDPGKYDKLMGTGGASEYSNVNTNWNVDWLISQDQRMYIQMQGLADLAGSYPINYREGTITKRYMRGDCGGATCAAGAGTGLGHWVTGVDRLTFRDEALYLSSTGSDNITPVSVTSAQYQASNGQSACIGDSGWDVGFNHLPDAFSHIYTVTGDPWYLDRIQAWAASSVTYHAKGAPTGQGPDASYATYPFLIDNRSTAWFDREAGLSTRQRAYAAFFSLDKSEDQLYFAQTLYDAVAGMEATHNITSDGSGAFGIVGQFQGDATYGAAWTWNYNNYYTPQNTKVDQLLGIYGQGQTAVIWSGATGSGQPETYGNFKPGRTIWNRLGGVNSPNANPNKLYPSHTSGVGVFDIQAGTDSTPGTTQLTTTARAMDSYSTVSSPANHGGYWQITLPTTVNLRAGDRGWLQCTSGSGACPDSNSAWSGLGTTTILSVDDGTHITINKAYGGDSFSAGTIQFFPLSVTLVTGGCAALVTSIPLPKKVYIDTGTNEEMFYVDSCPTSGGQQDVMSAQVSGAASWGNFGPGFGLAYVVFGLGRAYEMGFTRVLPMLTYLEHYYVDGLTSPDMNPWLFKQGYSATTLAADGKTPISTWALRKASSDPWTQADTSAEIGTSYRYMEFSFMASAYCSPTGLANCGAAQSWMQTNVKPSMVPTAISPSQPAPHNIMKNDILPRSITSACGITTTSPLPNGTINVAYSQTLAANASCTAPVTWSCPATCTMPSWASLNGSTGAISGTPNASGTWTFTLQARDSATPANTQTRTYQLTVPSNCAVTTISPLPTGSVGLAYSDTLASSGCVSPLAWSLAAGSLPSGLALSSAGVISGTPAAQGSSSFTVRVVDALNTISTQDLILNILANATSSNLRLGKTAKVGKTQ